MVPALAIADALRGRGAQVEFVGGERAEAELVPAAGYPFHHLRVAGLDRRNPLRAARAAALAAAAGVRARKLLRGMGADVAIGGGGYVAGPVGLAAVALRIPLILTEADSHLGVSNRLLARFARRVFLAYPLAGRDEPKYRVVGRPIPETSRPEPRAEARRRFDLPDTGDVLLVSGALAGARALNELAVSRFGASGPAVLHLAGERDYESLRGRVARPDYRLLPFTRDFGAALAASDLALTRSGGTVWELAAAGLPAVLVPYPHATGDHQTKNARHFERAGGAVVVSEDELERVPPLVAELLGDRARLDSMARAMRAAARPDAAEEIA